jgi:hypothetical protein
LRPSDSLSQSVSMSEHKETLGLVDFFGLVGLILVVWYGVLTLSDRIKALEERQAVMADILATLEELVP